MAWSDQAILRIDFFPTIFSLFVGRLMRPPCRLRLSVTLNFGGARGTRLIRRLHYARSHYSPLRRKKSDAESSRCNGPRVISLSDEERLRYCAMNGYFWIGNRCCSRLNHRNHQSPMFVTLSPNCSYITIIVALNAL